MLIGHQPGILQALRDQRLLDDIKDDANVLRVGGRGDMHVDALVGILLLVHAIDKAILDEFATLGVILWVAWGEDPTHTWFVSQ